MASDERSDYLLWSAETKERAVLEEARSLMKQSQHQKAIDLLTTAIKQGSSTESDASQAQLLFHLGVSFGNAGNHTETQRVANELLSRFPDRCEGFYLAGMHAIAQNGDVDEAKELFRRGVAADPRGSAASGNKDAATATVSRLEALLAKHKHQRYRDNIRRFGELVRALPNPTCPECSHVFASPTPEWLCTKCWPGKNVRVWQPDAIGVCCVCSAALGTMSRHHCRSCGKLCCGDCSSETMPVKILYFPDPVRVCSACAPVLKSRAERVRGRSPSPPPAAAGSRNRKRSPSPAGYPDIFRSDQKSDACVNGDEESK
jgi:hypothetical protein